MYAKEPSAVANSYKSPALIFDQAAVTDINTIYIPFTLLGRLIAFEARVDTVAGNFILDTGADRLLLNSNYFDNTDGRSTASAVDVTGAVGTSIRKKVDSLNIEQLGISNINAHVVDLSYIEDQKNTRVVGILGYTAIEDFAVFIDFPSRIIMFTRVDRKGDFLDPLQPVETAYDSLDFILEKHLIIIPSKVYNVSVRMAMDTGAELNLIDRLVRRKALQNFDIVKRVNLTGANGRDVEVLAGVLRDLYAGHLYCKRMNTLLTNLDNFNKAYGSNVQGVLGHEFIATKRMMINYKKEKLYFFKLARS